ncbi:hypothetical protein LOD99_11128 [Oopsacas minuta]|uniref:Uncharacterized protein n=1 Tax=Oopsacas minuta TaxID=111878 RepID=A0AAV7KA54_9METZ|nr:hypothetical protein LOD99_11128 [Oopsacas minuta]
MAIVFSIFGSCFCLCGLAFSIAFCVLVHLMVKKKKSRSQPIKTVQAPLPQSVAPPTAPRGLQDSTMEMKQQFKQETLPPQIPGYTYNPNLANTFDTAPYPPPMNAAMNIPANPTYLSSSQIVTDGIHQQPVHLQPVNAVPTDDETFAFMQ